MSSAENRQIKSYWEKCGLDYAHLLDSGKRPKDVLQRSFSKMILNQLPYPLEGKTIIDYGIGGGFLGDLLFAKHKIEKYIGIDIAERSLDRAKQILHGKNVRLYMAPQNFANFKADAFFTFACVQHFPSKEYLDDFLKNLQRSKIKLIAIHFRHHDETIFNNAYVQGGNMGLACRTNIEYISSMLSGYKLYYLSTIEKKSYARSVIYVRS